MSGEASLQAGTLWLREITRFRRQRSRVIGSFLQPLVFWLLLGAGLKASFRPAGMPAGVNYFEYLYPGFIVLVLLFTAIFATISTVEDRREGFLQGVLVAPISRPTIVMGQALGGTTLAWVPSCIFLVLAPFAGISLSVDAAVMSAAMMAIIAFALTCIGLMIA
jgi:ABC-2 type transport system permease protein